MRNLKLVMTLSILLLTLSIIRVPVVHAAVITQIVDFGATGLFPTGVAIDSSGDYIVVDYSAGTNFQGALFKVTPAGFISQIIDFGVGAVQGESPADIAIDSSGDYIIVDQNAGIGGKGALFKVTPAGDISQIADFGTGAVQGVNPWGIAIDSSGNYIVVDPDAGTGSKGALFRVTTSASVATATGTGTATFNPDMGTIESLTAISESTLPQTGKPNLSFPHGFFSFLITGLNPGTTVVVTITLPSAVPMGTQYWKYHASEGGWIQIPMGSDDGDNVITITLVDGGLGDDDGIANGVIDDQGGPGSPITIKRTSSVVGGVLIPVNNLIVLLPYFTLASIASIVSVVLITRRRCKEWSSKI